MKHHYTLCMQCLVFTFLVTACNEKITSTKPNATSIPVMQASMETPADTPTLRRDPATRERICNNAPGDVPGMNCIPPKLAIKGERPCRSEGEDVDGKDFGSVCCPGLTPIPTTKPSSAGCTSSTPPSIQICARCGDRICGVGENRCNCPHDCRVP